MSRTRIKFCGMTRNEDAQAAARLGADAVGLVFYPPSPRHVSVEIARDIVRALPAFVTAVGLFVDAAAEEIRRVAEAAGLNCAQLHGNETPEAVAELRPMPVIKAIHVHGGQFRQTLQEWREAIERLKLTNLRGLLLETAGPLAGGSGVENDWQVLAGAREDGWFDGLPPIIAAGGLTPSNVGTVIRRIAPWAVDVSSGVESTPGIKSADKMRAFAMAVSQARGS